MRRFATAWCTSAERRITAANSKSGVSLHLELLDRYDWVPVLTLSAAHVKGEFCL